MKLKFMQKALYPDAMPTPVRKYPLLLLSERQEENNDIFFIHFSASEASEDRSSRYKVLDAYDWVNYRNKKL